MADTSAFDQPEARGLRLIIATLRVAVAAQCFGAAILNLARPGTSNLAVLLVEAEKMLPDKAILFDQIAGGLLAACGMFSLTRPCWPVLGPVTIYFLANAFAKLGQGEHWTLYLEPLEHAARIALPLGLLILDWYPPRLKFSLFRFMTTGSLARTAAAVTFASHGVVALNHAISGGHFVTLIQDAAWYLADRSIPDGVVSLVLGAIGGIDIAVALNLLLTRSRFVSGWMVFWGFATAGSRIFHFPAVEGVGEMLVRFANGGAPLVVFLFWTLAVREREHVILPKKKKKEAAKSKPG